MMRQRSQIKKWIVAFAVCGVLLMAFGPALAQEIVTGETVSGEQPVAGLGTLVLLLGLGAVTVVGGLMILRDNYKAPDGE